MKSKYILGLDIGIASCGWAVTKCENNHCEIDDFGVRLWDLPEDAKSNDSKASFRRAKRSSRRLNQRKRLRKKELIDLMESTFSNLKEGDIKEYYEKVKSNKDYDSNDENHHPIFIRHKALTQKVGQIQLAIALLHICKRRGYNDKFALAESEKINLENSSKNENSNDRDKFGKPKWEERISEADKLIKKYGFIATALVKDARFKNKDKTFDKIAYRNKQLIKDDDVKKDSNFSKEKVTNEKLKEILNKELQKDNPSLISIALESGFLPSEIDKKLDELKIEKEKIKKFYNFILFDRADYEKEAREILKVQSKYYKFLSEDKINKIIDIIFRQRDFEDGPGPKNELAKKQWEKTLPSHLIRKSFIHKVGDCSIYSTEQRHYQSSTLNDLWILTNELSKILSPALTKKVLTKEQQAKIVKTIFDKYLKTGDKIKPQDVHGELPKAFKDEIPVKGIHLEIDKLFLMELKKVFPKYFVSIKDSLSFENVVLSTNKPNIVEVEKVIFENVTPLRRAEKLLNLKIIDDIDGKTKEDVAKLLLKVKFKKSPSHVSQKYMEEAIGQFANGENFAIFHQEKQAKANEERAKSEEKKEAFSLFIDEDLMQNATVFRAFNQTRKLIKALFKKYPMGIDVFAIEVARDLYNSSDERKRILNQQESNLKNKAQSMKELKEKLGLKEGEINTSLLERYSLWKSQKEIDIYDGEKINLKDLRSPKYQVDHIIPYSKLNDNSFNNKVLTSSQNNQDKGNRFPMEWLKNDKKRLEKYLDNIKKIASGKKDKKKMKTKLMYLKALELNDDILKAFESQNLNDTRYITKFFTNWLSYEVLKYRNQTLSLNTTREKVISDILSIPGRVTSNSRRNWLFNSPWGLEKVRDITPYHHAVDALILSQISSKATLNKYVYFISARGYFLWLKNNDKLSQVAKETKWRIYKREILNLKNISKEVKAELEDYFNKELIEAKFEEQKVKISSLNPIIKDFNSTIVDLIPLNLDRKKEKRIDKKTGEVVGEYDVPIVKKLDEMIVSPSEWSKRTNRDIKLFPYPSYKVNNKWKGNSKTSFLGSEQPQNKKDYWDEKTNKIKDGFEKDKNGNVWNYNSYFGVGENKEKNKMERIRVYDLIKEQKKTQKNNNVKYKNREKRLKKGSKKDVSNYLSDTYNFILSRNNLFEYDGNIYRYTGVGGGERQFIRNLLLINSKNYKNFDNTHTDLISFKILEEQKDNPKREVDILGKLK